MFVLNDAAIGGGSNAAVYRENPGRTMRTRDFPNRKLQKGQREAHLQDNLTTTREDETSSALQPGGSDTGTAVVNAPLTFPLGNKRLPPRLHVQAQVLHHAVDAVVQGQAAGLGLDGPPADGTLVLLSAPLLDAMTAEAVSAAQDDGLQTNGGSEKGSFLFRVWLLKKTSKVLNY